MSKIVLVVALAAFAPPVWAQGIAMQDEAGVRWACGGVGAGERATLATPRSQANLELLFVTAKRGGYLADVRVSLYAADAAAPRLKLEADGPICLLFAPAGRYRIEASYGGVTRTAQATAAAAAGKPSQVIFRFPEEPWNGTRASEEEKRQARE